MSLELVSLELVSLELSPGIRCPWNSASGIRLVSLEFDDKCYGTTGANKEQCDLKLIVHMTALCNVGSLGNLTCAPIGILYGIGLMLFGIPNPVFQPSRDAYNSAQRGH